LDAPPKASEPPHIEHNLSSQLRERHKRDWNREDKHKEIREVRERERRSGGVRERR
jgi:hypothetical protein